MSSKRFKSMESALMTLRREFLPRRFKNTGFYEQHDILKARAFRVLAHAEFEHYLEDMGKQVAVKALTDWKSSMVVSRPLIALVAFCGRMMEFPPDSLQPAQSNAAAKHKAALQLSERVNSAANAYYTSINENHGIKEKNLLSVLLPIGLDPAVLDPIWVIEINDFGEKRGEVAHSSHVAGSVRHPLNPRAEYESVKAICKGLKSLDKELLALM